MWKYAIKLKSLCNNTSVQLYEVQWQAKLSSYKRNQNGGYL